MNNRCKNFIMKTQHSNVYAGAHRTGRCIPGVLVCAGFTMVELIVSLAIVGILVSIAAPNVQSFFGEAKLSGRSSTLQSAISFARSEAIKRGAAVSLCARATDTSCGDATNWGQGWIVFSDSDVAGTQGKLDGGEEIMRLARFPGSIVDVKARAVVRPNAMAAVDSLRFNSRGLTDWTVGTYVLCDSRGSQSALALIVNGAGIVRLAENMNGSAAIDASGTEVTC